MLPGRLSRLSYLLIGLLPLVMALRTESLAGQSEPQQQAAPQPPIPKVPSEQAPAAPPSLQAAPSAVYVPSPYRSSAVNKRLLDSIGLRVILNFGYAKGADHDLIWKTKGLSGIEATSYFIKRGARDSFRTIELVIAASPRGGYELIVYGLQVEGAAESPNPDLIQVHQMVAEEITRLGQEPPIVDMQQLGYETYTLSYVDADRALGLLKVLGYTTVEYGLKEGESLYEKIYDPIQKGVGRPPIIVKLIDSPKTSLMQEAVAGIEAGGHSVLTFAPSAEASRGVLQSEGFAGATTVAELLVNDKLQQSARGQVIWIDEAGLLGTKTLRQVFDLAEQLDARVILSGDWKQHGSVERGPALRLLEQYAGLKPAHVREIQRQQGEYRDAVAAIARGDLAQGYEQLDQLGWIRELGDEDRNATIARDYVDSVRSGLTTLVVSPTHAEGQQITQAIRSELKRRPSA